MNFLNRRTFLKVVASIPFAVWLEREALAATTPVIRYNVLSTEGQAMLKIYADGVAKMKALPASDPRSWTFQWYIHAVPDDRTKTSELSRIYPVSSPSRTLASTVWSTCQAHFNHANEPFFLPWHRMYLLRFERIIRKLTNQPTFTLPYWNYSASGSTHGILPAAFRTTTSSLFVQNRIAAVNAGKPIDASSSGALATTALSQCSYNPQGAAQGFCQALDSSLHGNVHVLIGDKKNMGAVPWAARDPIFWLHHCNIDRLWASWNKGGRSNPNTSTFLSKTFTFADENGLQVVGKVSDVLSILALGYTYSAFDSVPPCVQTSSTATALTQSSRAASNVLAAAGPVVLASESVQVKLQMPEGRAASPDSTFDRQLRKSRLKMRVHLVLSKLRAAAPPNILYEVYIVPAKKAGTKPPARCRVGTMNFFNAVNHSEDPQSFDNDERFVSFDVTGLVRRWQLERRLKAAPLVIILPMGEPDPEARPEIGSIELILE
ncbi:MAG: tyrosinase family protein [Nitrospira sp.]